MKFPIWQKALPDDSAFLRQVTFIRSWEDRLVGFKNLTTNPKMWSFFGVNDRTGHVSGGQGRAGKLSDMFYHDGLTGAVVKYGAVPIFTGMVVGVFILFRVHRFQYNKLSGGSEKMFRIMLATIFASLVSLVAHGRLFYLFPANSLVWILIALVLLCFRELGKESSAKNQQEVIQSE